MGSPEHIAELPSHPPLVQEWRRGQERVQWLAVFWENLEGSVDSADLKSCGQEGETGGREDARLRWAVLASFPMQMEHEMGLPSSGLLAGMDCPQMSEHPGGSQEENRISEVTGGNCGWQLMNGRM